MENFLHVKATEMTNEHLPIRVLHILGSVQRGGTESVVFNNYRYIDKSKVQFDISIDDNSPCDIPKSITDLGCKIYHTPPYTRTVAYIRAITNICKQGNYRIVHSHMNAMSIFSLSAAYLAGVPIRIAHSHTTAGKGRGEIIRNVFKYALRPFSKIFANKYFACSEHAAIWLFGKRVVEKKQVFILSNAIDTNKFAYNLEMRDALRSRLDVSNKFVIGHVGRFSPQKNHLFIIEVFNVICKMKDNFVLLLIGSLGSMGGKIEDRLHKRIDELGLNDKVIFFGSSQDISGLYQAMDVFLLPSLYEGLGMVCIEAQCSGLPCILSNRVPKVVKINNNVKFISLDQPIEKWAKEIIEIKGKRGDWSEQIAQFGYDINKEAKVLEAKYIEFAESTF